jgi:hypothetical protein
MTTKRICKGYYEVTDKNGKKWIVQHLTKAEGFDYDEWAVGTPDDELADQCNTKRECLEAIAYCADHPELYS